jgi:hypothetical protein
MTAGKKQRAMTAPVRIVVAGLAGGAALNAAMIATFRTLGFGWRGDGMLLDPALQSPKLIAVWTTLEPLPLVIMRPAVMAAGLVLFAIVHAGIYANVASAWPEGLRPRTTWLAAVLFSQFAFWEFFTPFNQFGEPALLIAVELSFWAFIALAEAVAIVSAFESLAPSRQSALSKGHILNSRFL